MIRLYILIFGIFFITLGMSDLIMPRRIFSVWRAWSSSKFFFLHGLLLIAAGLPLTVYDGRFSPFIFITGLIVVLSGPFVLLYPDKFRQMFQAASDEFNDWHVKKLMYVEGAVRIAVGAVCVAAYFMQ